MANKSAQAVSTTVEKFKFSKTKIFILANYKTLSNQTT